MIYRAFVEGELDVAKHLARRVHDPYFNPQIEEFAPQTTWSLSNPALRDERIRGPQSDSVVQRSPETLLLWCRHLTELGRLQ